MTLNRHNFKITTSFNEIDAVFNHDILTLQGKDDSMQSELDMSCPHNLMMVNLQWMMAALLFRPEPQKLLMLGTAGGSLLHFIRHYYPDCHITAIDCDADLLEILQARSILPQASSQLDYVIDDAFEYLKSCRASYDFIIVDLFLTAQSPEQLVSQEVTDELFRIMSNPGIVVANLIFDNSDDLQQMQRYWTTRFDEQVLEAEVEGLENQLLFAFKGQFAYQSMGDRLQLAQQLSGRHGIDYSAALRALFASNPIGQGIL